MRTALTVAALLLSACAGATAPPETARLAPEFTATRAADWINSPPLRLSQLEGKVALVEFWTFDCYNCVRSIPWLQSVERRMAPRGLRIVGIHTPELEHERVAKNVQEHVRRLGVDWPVMLDTDGAYWNAMGNRFWPTFYLIDKRGLVRAALAGETHEGDFNATQIESLVDQLLAEPG